MIIPSCSVRPADQRLASLRSKRHADRELVRRRQDHGADVLGEHVDIDPELVDRHRNGLDAEPARDHLVVVVTGVLDRDAPDPVSGQRAEHEVDPLSEARADKDLLGIGDRAADAPQITGEHPAQDVGAARVTVIQLGRRRLAAALAQRPRPSHAAGSSSGQGPRGK